MNRRIVIVGAGMAAGRLVEDLLAQGCPGAAITLVAAERGGVYNRIALTPYLAGDVSAADLVTHSPAWFAARGVTLLDGVAVQSIDRASKTVTLQDQRELPYDQLVLATGSQPIRLPIPGAENAAVQTYRDRADADALISRAIPGQRAVVIGGGLLGLEAANGLNRRGMAVTVVHLVDRVMERQLDAEAASMVQRALEARGIALRTGAITQRIEDDAVLLGSGERLPADLVVIAVGIRPEITLARAADLECGRGVKVDDQLRTSDALVFAVGECAEHRGVVHGLVAPLYDQTAVAARALLGEPAAYAGSIPGTGLKVTGVDLYSVGDFADGPGRAVITLRDRRAGEYRRLVVSDDRLIGVVLVGAIADGAWYADLIRSGRPLGPMRRDLAFGRAYAPEAAAA